MTLEEYEKVLEEKRKALDAEKNEERKVEADKAFASMQLVDNKKREEDIFIKLVSLLRRCKQGWMPSPGMLAFYLRLGWIISGRSVISVVVGLAGRGQREGEEKGGSGARREIQKSMCRPVASCTCFSIEIIFCGFLCWHLSDNRGVCTHIFTL